MAERHCDVAIKGAAGIADGRFIGQHYAVDHRDRTTAVGTHVAVGEQIALLAHHPAFGFGERHRHIGRGGLHVGDGDRYLAVNRIVVAVLGG